MFHLEQGWWLGVKRCSARAIYTNAEGRKGEVDISVRLAGVQANPWCVCFYLCADWWNELWVWEIDSGWGWSPSLPFLASLAGRLSVCTPPSSLPAHQLVPLTCFLSLKADLKMGEKKTPNNTNNLVLSVLFYLTRCLLAQVKLLHHFCIFFFACFIWPASQILLSSLKISATVLFNISWNLLSLVSGWLCLYMWVTEGLPLCFFVLCLRFNLTIVQVPNSSPLLIHQAERLNRLILETCLDF